MLSYVSVPVPVPPAILVAVAVIVPGAVIIPSKNLLATTVPDPENANIDADAGVDAGALPVKENTPLLSDNVNKLDVL